MRLQLSSSGHPIPENPCASFIKLMLAAFVCMLSTSSARADQHKDAPSSFPGQIEALVSVDVSNLIEGVITEVHFKSGQFVEPGDVLFSLDATDFELAVENMRLNAVRAETALRSARQDFERIQKLKDKGSATEVQMFKAEIALSIGAALVDQAKAELKDAETNLERTTIRSPIAGVISQSEVRPGSYVKQGRGPLARIDQMDPVLLEYAIPYVERLEQLQIDDLRSPKEVLEPVTLRIQISDTWTYSETAKPENMSPRVDFSSGTLTIWAELANPKHLLRPGMRVRVVPVRDGE